MWRAASPGNGLFSEGVFDKTERFYPVTGLSYKRMEEYFRLSVLGMLKKEGLIFDELIRNLLGWKHSGFNIHAEGKQWPMMTPDANDWRST